MKTTESKKSHSSWWDSHISPKNSKWLAENLEEMDQSVKRMLKLIEEDGDSFAKNAEVYHQKKPELIAHVEEFCRMHQTLAERYDHLTGELRKNLSSELQTQGSGISESGSDPAFPLLTPDQKLGTHKSGHQAVGLDLFFSSGGGSSDLSLKEGTESSSSSSSSSDSESESFNSIKNYSGQPMNGDGKELVHKIIELETELPSTKEKDGVANEGNVGSMLKVGESGDYEELLGRVSEYEEELRVSNLKLQFSEEEIARLKRELMKYESITVLAGNLQAQLESAQRDIKMREADLELEKRQVLELHKQIAELETHISDSNHKIGTLVEELEITRGRLKRSEEEIAKLKNDLTNEISEGTHQLRGQLELAWKDIAMLQAELDTERRQVLEMQERIVRYIADVSDRDREVEELSAALCDAEENFCQEKAQLQSDISSLFEQQNLLESKLKEWELQSKCLENEIGQCESEKMKMKGLHEACEVGLQGEISGLKAELTERGELMEALNKNLDMLKLKYDTLMSEKDGVTAKVHTLVADVTSRDNQIHQMEEHLHRLHMEHVELTAGSENARKVVDELTLRVKELEKEVDRQRVVLLDRAEEKREAIRQLCFSLEHYRSGYQELRQAFIGQKRLAVLAS